MNERIRTGMQGAETGLHSVGVLGAQPLKIPICNYYTMERTIDHYLSNLEGCYNTISVW